VALTGNWCIRTFQADLSTWASITVPAEMEYGCNQVVVRCDSDSLLIGDPSVQGAVDTLPQSVQEVMGAPAQPGYDSWPQFTPGQVACYVQTKNNPTANVIVRFVR
jgi:hypothetical protein